MVTGALWGCCSSSVDGASAGSVATGANDGAGAEVATTVDFHRLTAPPTIDESDIVKSDGEWLYVLSQYAGLNVIDASVPRAPKLAARLDALAGNGGELYVRDQGLLVLVKDSKLSCHALAPSELAHYPSIGIASIAQPTNAPEVVSERCVSGDLVTSRLVGDTLHVVTTAAPVEPDRGWLYAVDVASPNALEVVADLPLAGASFEIHMTSEAVFVAEDRTPDTKIRYIDISSDDGPLRERGEIAIAGTVPGRFHMDALGNTLRVVTSDATTDGNHLHVIDTSEPDSLQLLASIGALAPGERLFATRFVPGGERRDWQPGSRGRVCSSPARAPAGGDTDDRPELALDGYRERVARCQVALHVQHEPRAAAVYWMASGECAGCSGRRGFRRSRSGVDEERKRAGRHALSCPLGLRWPSAPANELQPVFLTGAVSEPHLEKV